jgi:outer membrane protein OmpA-like peptidoglycan-associated protein
MKKCFFICLMAGFLVMGTFSISNAASGNYYRWQSNNLTTMAPSVPAEKCEYHQWRNRPCRQKMVETPAPKKERIVLEGIYFDTGSANIKRESYSVLDSNTAKLKSKTNKSIVIVGHTDNVGSDTYNKKLSEARAKSVMNYFASRGISSSRIRSVGQGEMQPISTNTTESGRSQNRRIEVELVR